MQGKPWGISTPVWESLPNVNVTLHTACSSIAVGDAVFMCAGLLTGVVL